MSNFLNTFKTNFNGGSRANRFLVEGAIPLSTGGNSRFTPFHIRSTILPQVMSTTLTYDFMGRKFHYPGEKQYSTWAFVVLDDSGNNNLWGHFSRWQNRINDNNTNQSFLVTSPQTSYKADNWNIHQLNLNGDKKLKTFVLHGCWPVQVGQINFNMASANTMNTFQVMIMFDTMEIRGNDGSIITERG
jgi:hypothetical protein